MREILFRGKVIKDGIWVYGYANYIGGKANINTVEFDEKCDTPTHEYFKINGVLLETVGQYTGMTDKNGKKIFEGDIVAGALYWLEHKKNGVVTFRDGSFGLLWYRGEAEQFNPFTSMCNIVYEVIGNIHDNPELLKGVNDDA